MTQTLRLDMFAEVGTGNSAPQNEELFEGGSLPFVRTSDVGAIHIGSIETSRDLLTLEGAKGLKLQPSGTILFPKSGASTFLNHRVVLSKPAYVSSHLATIKANSDFALDRYLFYFLQTIDARDLCQDQAYPSLNREQIAGIEVPLPTLEKQYQVVAKLDNAFAELEALEEARAVVGVEAAGIFDAAKEEIFMRIAKRAGKTTLGKSCEYLNGSAHEKIIDKDGQYVVVNSKYISSEGVVAKYSKMARSPLDINDIAMVLSDVPNGKALAKCFLIEEVGKFTLNQRICRIRSKNFIPQFLFYQLNRNKYLLSFDNGENQTNLRLKDVLDCPLLFPSLRDQEEAVTILDEIEFETSAIKVNILEKRNLIAGLGDSMLSTAFSEVA